MEITPPASVAMGPPIHSSPEMDHSGGITNGTYVDSAHQNGSMTNGLSAAAATSSQQPKVVQTAFIHKLYKYVFFFFWADRPRLRPANERSSMLEDTSIQNLISWSNNNESFVMSPSTDFSKVLA